MWAVTGVAGFVILAAPEFLNVVSTLRARRASRWGGRRPVSVWPAALLAPTPPAAGRAAGEHGQWWHAASSDRPSLPRRPPCRSAGSDGDHKSDDASVEDEGAKARAITA